MLQHSFFRRSENDHGLRVERVLPGRVWHYREDLRAEVLKLDELLVERVCEIVNTVACTLPSVGTPVCPRAFVPVLSFFAININPHLLCSFIVSPKGARVNVLFLQGLFYRTAHNVEHPVALLSSLLSVFVLFFLIIGFQVDSFICTLEPVVIYSAYFVEKIFHP